MVFGLSPPSSSSSSVYSRPLDEVSTVKASGRRSSRSSGRRKKEKFEQDYREPQPSTAGGTRRKEEERSPDSFFFSSSSSNSGGSTGGHHNDFDEGYIQQLITEGLWSEKNEIIEDVLNKISNLMFTSDEELKTNRRDAIFRAGGHLAIVQAMKRHLKVKGIQTQGCRALANATWETSEFMNAITAVGGVDVILGAMVQFPQDEVVQICGSCAMRNLTLMKHIAKMFVERNGLPVILNSMKTFPMNANIQECGCWTIAHLCLDRDNYRYIKKVKCFSSIGAAADNHCKQAEVLVAARAATERLWEILLR